MKPIRLKLATTLHRNGHPLAGHHVFEITVNEFGEPEIRNMRHESAAQRGPTSSVTVGTIGDVAVCDVDLEVEAAP